MGGAGPPRDEPLVHPDRDEIEARIDRTADVWATWSVGIEAPESWREQVRTSARTLKLLTHQRTGAPIDALWRYVERGNELDPGTGALLRDLADHLCDVWPQEDAGIWELPETAHYTVSKLGAWTALDRAQRLVDLGQLDGDTTRWAAEQSALRDFVESRCWSPARRSFTFHADTDDLDASCLLAGRMGYASTEQLEGTIAAVQEELADGPFVWRFSGMEDRENAFLASSFWLADALARVGRLDAASQQIDGALAAANDLGLLAEEYAPASGEALGNVPQGLSHLSFVNAVTTYVRCRDGS